MTAARQPTNMQNSNQKTQSMMNVYQHESLFMNSEALFDHINKDIISLQEMDRELDFFSAQAGLGLQLDLSKVYSAQTKFPVKEERLYDDQEITKDSKFVPSPSVAEVYQSYVSSMFDQEYKKISNEFEKETQKVIDKLHGDVRAISSGRSPKRPEQGKRKRETLSKESRKYLKQWLHDHRHNPYPTDQEKQIMVEYTGLTLTQLNNWFVNGRKRYLNNSRTQPPHVRRKIELKNQLLKRFKKDKSEK